MAGSRGEKLGFNATWSMAVGGMIGGGIFSTLGVVINIAGSLAWLSFTAAGLVALASGYSYSRLAEQFGEGGGAFTFLREAHAENLAGNLSWILSIGYVFTNAVYAFTFGQYLGSALGVGPLATRLAAVLVVSIFVVINLKGVAEASGVEIFLVWFKLVVLVGLALFGIARWNPAMLSQGVPHAGISNALFGAAAVFMAYEGFQLLTYDYEDIRNPNRILPRAVLSAIVAVMCVYVLVAVGTVMLIGADRVVANQEVALAVAAREAAGVAGLVIVTIAAAFSTSSAINSTLFATARLAHTVARAGELPGSVAHLNKAGVPDRAIIVLGSLAALLAATGSLVTLVSAASLTFLVTFTIVNLLAFRQRAGSRVVTLLGALGAFAATIALTIQLTQDEPAALAYLVVMIAASLTGRWLSRRWRR